MALYAPILESNQPAFVVPVQNGYNIGFKLSEYTNLSEVSAVSVRIVKLYNNKSIANTNIYPDGIIYKNINSNAFVPYINISNEDIFYNPWEAGTYYKVQVRLCGRAGDYQNGVPAEKEKFLEWRKVLRDNNQFSEWSVPMIIKAIDSPKVEIINNNVNFAGISINSIEATETTTTPTFFGKYFCLNENEEFFKFNLYNENKELIETSDWILHKVSDAEDSYRFSTILEEDKIYLVDYSVTTENLYEKTSSIYRFTVQESFLNKLENVVLYAISEEPENNEEGYISLLLDAEKLTGNYVITRSSEYSDYKEWEDIKYLLFDRENFNKTEIFRDYTIESGIKYKYAFQSENSAKIRTMPIENIGGEKTVNFQHTYLYNNGKQLKIKFNNKISSFKHSVLASKQDTLGSKYPTIKRNGYAYYAEFPINGTISLHMDDNQEFFKEIKKGFTYNNELIIDKDKFFDDGYYRGSCSPFTNNPENIVLGETKLNFDTNLTDDNIFIERKFREKVEEFLNDGGYKLYKSATEGNILITLMNVSMTPNQTLGRMIFDFSATAYEVGDTTIENLDKYGLINVGSFKSEIDKITTVFGQLSGLFKGKADSADGEEDDLYSLIIQQNSYSLGDGYRSAFKRLKSIRIEPYPKIDYSKKVAELESKISDIKNSEDKEDQKKLKELTLELEELTKLIKALSSQTAYPRIIMIINGKEIALGSGKTYNLSNQDITSLKVKSTMPLVINYVCETYSVEDEDLVVSAVVSSDYWAQLYGVFTNTKKVLDAYDNERKEPPFLIDNGYKYNVYQTQNIFDIIQEDTRLAMEKIFNCKFEWDEEFHRWDSGKINYEFVDIKKLDIEADPGTRIIITKDNGTEEIVIVGSTGRYRLINMNHLIKGIRFEKPTYAIISYIVTTIQTLLKERGERAVDN